MTILRIACALLIVIGCGDDGGETGVDASSQGETIGNAAVGVFRMSGSFMTLIVAGFAIERDVPISMRDDGSCHVRIYDMMTEPLFPAGTVTFSGGTGAPIVLLGDANNSYAQLIQGERFVAGDVVVVEGTGATVPAFTSTVMFPTALNVTNPLTLASVHKTGFGASWTPTPTPVTILFLQYSSSRDVTVRCTFDGSTGSATVSASALADLTNGVNVAVSIRSETETKSTAGDYPFSFEAIYAPFLAQVPVQP
jgi:hypothetical protein